MQKKKCQSLSQSDKKRILKLVHSKVNPLSWKYNKQNHKNNIVKTSKNISLTPVKSLQKDKVKNKKHLFSNLYIQQLPLVNYKKQQNYQKKSILNTQKLLKQQKNLKFLSSKNNTSNKQNTQQSKNLDQQSKTNDNYSDIQKNHSKFALAIDKTKNIKSLEGDLLLLENKKMLKKLKNQIQNKKTMLLQHMIRKKQSNKRKLVKHLHKQQLKKQFASKNRISIINLEQNHLDLDGQNKSFQDKQNCLRHSMPIQKATQLNLSQHRYSFIPNSQKQNQKKYKQALKITQKRCQMKSYKNFCQQTQQNKIKNIVDKQEEQNKLERQQHRKIIKQYAQFFRSDLKNTLKNNYPFKYQIVKHDEVNKIKEKNVRNTVDDINVFYRRNSEHRGYIQDQQTQISRKNLKKSFSTKISHQPNNQNNQKKSKEQDVINGNINDPSLINAKMRIRSNHKKIIDLGKSTKLFSIMGHSKYSSMQVK